MADRLNDDHKDLLDSLQRRGQLKYSVQKLKKGSVDRFKIGTGVIYQKDIVNSISYKLGFPWIMQDQDEIQDGEVIFFTQECVSVLKELKNFS